MVDNNNIYLDLKRIKLTDLDIYQCGTEACQRGHDYGPAVRDHYLIHYINSGKGIFCSKDKVYQLGAGQGFLIVPNEVSYYRADQKEPWVYSWVGFHGCRAEAYLHLANLSEANPIFILQDDRQKDTITQLWQKMIRTNEVSKTREIRLVGYLYIFLSYLIEQFSAEGVRTAEIGHKYLLSAIDYIGKNYYRKISVQEIANYLGLDRSYLWSIFKKGLNISPQQFIINYRLEKACQLLMNNKLLTIRDIASSVGYNDPSLFSKIFKKIYGYSPRAYPDR